jgi:adenylosuccinate lyase
MSLSNVEFQAKRLKFSLKKGSRERLFTQLQVANDRMRSLLESSDHIVVASRTRGTAKSPFAMSRKINEFWRHAKRLYEALSKAWECGGTSHVANLQLQHRISDKVEFDVLFMLGATPTHRKWQETRIKMIPGVMSLSTVGVTTNLPPSATTFGGGGVSSRVQGT